MENNKLKLLFLVVVIFDILNFSHTQNGPIPSYTLLQKQEPITSHLQNAYSSNNPFSSNIFNYTKPQNFFLPPLPPHLFPPPQFLPPTPHIFGVEPEPWLRPLPDTLPLFYITSGGGITLPPLPYPQSANCQAFYGIPRKCVQRSMCFATFGLYANIPNTATCFLPNRHIGVCCPVSDLSHSIAPYEVDDFYEDIHLISQRDTRDYEEAFQEAEEYLKEVQEESEDIQNQKPSSGPEDVTIEQHQGMHRTTREIRERSRQGILLNQASQVLIRKHGNEVKYSLATLWNTPLKSTCRSVPQCQLSPYRSFDEICNNLKYPLWGSTNSILNRLLPPDYADGVSSPRGAQDKTPLPSARVLSLNIATDVNNPHPTISHMFMSYGQFVAHDLTRTAVSTGSHGESIFCCKKEQENQRIHPECFPIPVPDDDPWLGGTRCMDFVRSLPAQSDNCKIHTHREQMNQVTSTLDGSFLYGSSAETVKTLRTFIGGKFKTSTIRGEIMLPKKNVSHCGNSNMGILCFDGGDNRLNQEPPILSLHVLLLREHNSLATHLAELNPQWSDERLFQEARKIVVAKLQHITFNEFLPLIIDYETRRKYGLLIKADGYSNNYDPRLKPNILNEFQVAAFRMGHSMVQNTLALFKGGYSQGAEKLEDNYFNPILFYTKENFIELLVQGLTIQNAQQMDRYYSASMSRHLFKSQTSIGMDIYAINIQRGRDNGIPGYNAWRAKCGLPLAKDFDDLSDFLYYDHIDLLRRNYKHVNDIDLYAGGILERPIPGSLVGPTFRCIIADQFRRIRLADRFWYERYNKNEGVGFTSAQLQEIRKTTLSRILCDNTKITQVHPLSLLVPSNTNPGISCESNQIPKMSVAPWKSTSL